MDKKAQWSLVAAAWVLAIGIIAMGVAALMRFGTASAAPSPAAAASPAAGRAICPVDHVEVVIGPDTPKANYEGTTYYFCSSKDALGHTHKELFLMDPKLYLSGVSSYAVAVSPAAALPAAPAAAASAPAPPAAAVAGAATPPPSPSASSPSAAPTTQGIPPYAPPSSLDAPPTSPQGAAAAGN
jgi:YHS domain-containing protein